jgi:NADPH:quinone reductase-like Zn-dependent oxidoreductase
MKAFLYEAYGPPERLRMAEVDKPVPDADEVLVEVLGASVNPADWHSMRGKPLFSRLTLGLLGPKHKILGVDVAGRVETVGSGVTTVKPGDEVYANLLDHGYGGFAEYVSVPADGVALKPANLSFEKAAAVPMAAVTALQGLRHHGEIQPGQKVLINGASGGVGTYAVQLAKLFGADVTGVCSTGKVDLARSLGADRVVDYTQEDFARLGERFDLMLDIAGSRPFREFRRVLTPEATVVIVGAKFPSEKGLGPLSHVIGTRVAALGRSQTVKFFIAKVNSEDLGYLGELLEAGTLKSVIDRRFALGDAADALRYLGEGHARGKVIITV